MDARLTTHVLDTALGRPAAGVRVTLDRVGGGRVADVVTNADGRTDGPLMGAEGFVPGVYELTFHVGDYLRASGAPGVAVGEPAFLDLVPVRFGMAGGHHHVPLLLSAHGYATYRGS